MGRADEGESPRETGREPQAALAVTDIARMGSLVEALELACRLVRQGSGKTLTERLLDARISKDFYYRRAQEFKKHTTLDLSEQIEAECLRQEQGVPHAAGDLFDWYEAIRDLGGAFTASKAKTRLRLGVSDNLTRSLVQNALQRFYQHPEFSEDRVTVDINFGFSKELFHRFYTLRQLDVYLSLAPESLPEEQVETMATVDFEFCIVCPHGHPAARALDEEALSGAIDPKIDWSVFRDTTLIVVGANPRRLRQYPVTADFILRQEPSIRIVEVDSFFRAHDLVTLGSKDVAAVAIPEFMSEEHLRVLSLIRFGQLNCPPPAPLTLCVLRHRRLSNEPADSRQGAIDHLASVLAMSVRSPFEQVHRLAARLGHKVHVCYERTRPESRLDRSADSSAAGISTPRPARGWVHSVIHWHFLRNGVVVGKHYTEHDRSPAGELTDVRPREAFSVVGRLIGNESDSGWQLVWSGISEHAEAYAASFVIPSAAEATDSSLSDLVGVWTGRRTTEQRLEPGSGVIVVLSHHRGENGELSATGDNATAILDRVLAAVSEHGERFPEFIQWSVAEQWEWSLNLMERQSGTRLNDVIRQILDEELSKRLSKADRR